MAKFVLCQVLSAGEHVINGKKVDPKRAKARPGKIFVGGLIPEITNDDVRNYFSAFGNVRPLFVHNCYKRDWIQNFFSMLPFYLSGY